MKNLDRDTIILSTGRTMYANCGIIGIDPELNVSQGYDGQLFRFGENSLTPEERREISDYMIDLWTRFGEASE